MRGGGLYRHRFAHQQSSRSFIKFHFFRHRFGFHELTVIHKLHLAHPDSGVRAVVSILLNQDRHCFADILRKIILDLGAIYPLALMDRTPTILLRGIFSGHIALRLNKLDAAILQNNAQTDVNIVGICITASMENEFFRRNLDLVGEHRFRNAIRSRFLRGGPCNELRTGIMQCIDSRRGIPLPLFQCLQITPQAPSFAVFIVGAPHLACVHTQQLPLGVIKARHCTGKRNAAGDSRIRLLRLFIRVVFNSVDPQLF